MGKYFDSFSLGFSRRFSGKFKLEFLFALVIYLFLFKYIYLEKSMQPDSEQMFMKFGAWGFEDADSEEGLSPVAVDNTSFEGDLAEKKAPCQGL